QDLILDPATHDVWRGDENLQLARKEFAILELLMRRQGEVVSQEVLLEHVWDSEANPFTNVVPVHISSLRTALGDDARQPRYIRTIVGTGYQLLVGMP
ncbi:MAG: winged helix-turn-helix domain-containing protein, partial [Chloroflexota bacterium]